MTTAMSVCSADNRRALIEAALQEELTGPFASSVRFEGRITAAEPVRVSVTPLVDVGTVYSYMSAVASAEMRLRDSGLSVSLTPDVRPREFALGYRPAAAPVAYLTRDGDEPRDLATILDCAEADLDWVRYSAYAYDNDSDLAIVLEEARCDHPDADFSRVEAPWAA